MLLNEVKSYGYLERNMTQSFKISDEWLFLPWNTLTLQPTPPPPPPQKKKRIIAEDVF